VKGRNIWVQEAGLDVYGSDAAQTLRLDNIRIGDFYLDFDLPDGSTLEDIQNNRHAGWEPYEEGENFRTKLMLHGMTDAAVQDLVPLAQSWTKPADLKIKGPDFGFKGYDPTQMAYVLEQFGGGPDVLEMKIAASETSPLIKPAFVIHQWKPVEFELSMNEKMLVEGTDYKIGIVRQLEGNDLILWLNVTSSKAVSLKLVPLNQGQFGS